jgi:hypothetical protein
VQQCANATRRVGQILRDSVRQLLVEEGVEAAELDATVAEVQRLLQGP